MDPPTLRQSPYCMPIHILARKLDTGHYAVDLAELRRVFPSARPVATGTGAAATEHKGFTFPVWDVG